MCAPWLKGLHCLPWLEGFHSCNSISSDKIAERNSTPSYRIAESNSTSSNSITECLPWLDGFHSYNSTSSNRNAECLPWLDRFHSYNPTSSNRTVECNSISSNRIAECNSTCSDRVAEHLPWLEEVPLLSVTQPPATESLSVTQAPVKESLSVSQPPATESPSVCHDWRGTTAINSSDRISECLPWLKGFHSHKSTSGLTARPNRKGSTVTTRPPVIELVSVCLHCNGAELTLSCCSLSCRERLSPEKSESRCRRCLVLASQSRQAM